MRATSADRFAAAGVLRDMPAVVVLVGTSGTGKTMFRRRLLEGGLPPDRVVSLDDLRREARAEDLARGFRARPLQGYSAAAVRRALRRGEVMAAVGTGYVADATHLVRRDRRVHVSIARDTGLPAVAVLTPLVDLEALLRRDLLRPTDERVPAEALARQHHRRALLSPHLLVDEGFDLVHAL
jgi:predicted kinase